MRIRKFFSPAYEAMKSKANFVTSGKLFSIIQFLNSLRFETSKKCFTSSSLQNPNQFANYPTVNIAPEIKQE